ncbi:hypothetical protein COE50_06460 [Bacillus anthracis]|nr:hypothetical protein COE50_06460 [Bacillus anthracis]
MGKITFPELWDIALEEKSFSVHYARVFSLMECLERSGVLKTIDADYLFYPKKIFRERGDGELLFFSKDTIMVSNMRVSGNLTVRTFLTKNIYKLELLNFNIDNLDVELIIHILDEEPIILSNIKDSSVNLRNSFYKLILDIYAKLTTLK